MRTIQCLVLMAVLVLFSNVQAGAPTKKSSASAKSAAVSKINKKEAKTTRLVSKSKTNKAVVKISKAKKIERPVYEVPSVARSIGLNTAYDELDLNSSVAFVVDKDTNEVLLRKNESAVLPIASITKLMTAIVITEANLPMDEMITITGDDVRHASFSRLKVGATMTRRDMVHLALMSSENRAAYALGRTYPAGIDEFVRLMNQKAMALGMFNTHYVEPTGLSSDNRSTAQDLAKLVAFASQNPLVSEFSTTPSYQLASGNRTVQYGNTNRLTSNPNWEIDVQKTGYISAAGRCLVMQAKVAGRKLVMVFLDSAGKYSRLADAERVKNWLENRRPNAPHAADRKIFYIPQL